MPNAALKKIQEDTGYGELTPVEQIGALTALLDAVREKPDDDYGQWAARKYGADAITVSEMWEIVKFAPTSRRLDIICMLLATWHMTNNPQAQLVVARAKELFS